MTRVPTRQQAEAYLAEGETRNPGPWVRHSRYVAQAAEAIGGCHPSLDADAAYVMGLLHDIGRREGVGGMRHVLDGYRFLTAEGYPDAARVCLTHTFPVQDIAAAAGEWDCSAEDRQFVADWLAATEYTDYDRLVQLCDALALPSGFCLIEKRLVDVALRLGVNACTVEKWQAFLRLRNDFEAAIARSVYSLLPGVVATTFGCDPRT